MWYQHSPAGGGVRSATASSPQTAGFRWLNPAGTCRVLLRNGASVEHRSILGDGPHLIGSTDGDGLEGLVCAHVQPGAALEGQTGQHRLES